MKNQETFLNTDDRLFLIKFAWKSKNSKFICTSENLGRIIEKQNTNGVEYIKEFDPIKNKFSRISKDKLNMLTSFDTETNLTLEKNDLI